MVGCSQSPPPAQNPASSASAATASSAAPAAAQTTAAAQAAPYTPPSADQLYQMVAPIALFPDNLVAQVLAGSTYPDQIAAADTFLTQNPGLKGTALQAQVNPQSWDASVKALTTFPTVLDQMARNPQWTSALGEAYVNDPTDVMNAIQVMRQRAAQKGNLRSNAQQVVQTQPVAQTAEYADNDQGSAYYSGPSVVQAPAQAIEIMPAQQDTVYVPSYNPQTVYGGDVPVYPSYSYQGPQYSTGEIVTAGAITFGAGILIGTLLDNHHHDRNYNPPPPPGGGWHSWGMHWGGRGSGGGWQRPAVIHNNTTYVSNSTTIVNRYTTNNINNSRTTINHTGNINNNRTTVNNTSNINNSRNQVVENHEAGRPAGNNLPHSVANEHAAPAPHGPMSIPHFGSAPQGANVPPGTRPAEHVPNTLARPEAVAHRTTMPQPLPAHAPATESNREPNHATREMSAAQPRPPHATPATRPAVTPRAEPHPAMPPHVAAAPRPAPAQHPRPAAAPAQAAHPHAEPAKDEKHSKDDKNEHS
ncbi:hypothetical protein B0E46_08290 [Rhodanobacter sp. B04]|nr:hypothetical protein B0E46_08290 [Rhodanobacter sp. B04]